MQGADLMTRVAVGTFLVMMSVTMAASAASITAEKLDSIDPETLKALHEAGLVGLLGSGSAEVHYPDRPNVFKSPVELRQYLSALNAYYAIAGRPRFGKRDSHNHQLPYDLYDY